jgi:hypothetical protein
MVAELPCPILPYLNTQGALLVAAASLQPSLVLVADASGAVGTTLAGCASAGLLTAAGLLAHVAAGVRAGEAATWRLQRIAAGVGVYGGLCALAALPSATTAAPLLTACVRAFVRA